MKTRNNRWLMVMALALGSVVLLGCGSKDGDKGDSAAAATRAAKEQPKATTD